MAIKSAVFVYAYYAVKALGRDPQLCAWDCPYYKTIATTGYYYTPTAHGPLAFFPLMPNIVKGLHFLLERLFSLDIAFEWIALPLNLFLFGVASFLLMIWSRRLGLKLWWLPALLWTVDRHTLWAQIPYTESLFMVLLLSFLLLAAKPLRGAGHALSIALLGGVASATRIVGVSLVGALGLGNFKYFWRRPLLGAATLLIGLSGVIAFFTYVHFQFGAWNLSLETTEHWGRHYSFWGIFSSAWILIKHGYFPTLLTLSLSLWWLVRPPHGIYLSPAQRWVMAFLIYIPMANSVPISLTRYFSVLVIGYIAWAWLIENYPRKWWAWALALAAVPEIFWQAHLLGKFLRSEVFFWVA